MRFITAKKAANGLGASGTGTAHHWAMTVSSWALLVLTPLFLIVTGTALGKEHAEVVAYFSRPYPALITLLFIVVGMLHFIKGTRIMIDDYAQGMARKAGIIISVLFSWTVIAAAAFGLIRMALMGS